MTSWVISRLDVLVIGMSQVTRMSSFNRLRVHDEAGDCTGLATATTSIFSGARQPSLRSILRPDQEGTGTCLSIESELRLSSTTGPTLRGNDVW